MEDLWNITAIANKITKVRDEKALDTTSRACKKNLAEQVGFKSLIEWQRMIG